MLTAIVLGGTLPHVMLVEKLIARGYYVVLVDYLENPPAKTVAHEHIKESTLDLEKVLAIAVSRSANLVISTCIDQANVTACYVSEKLGLPAPYSYETALMVTNKLLMKDCMIRYGIPTSRYLKASSIDDIKSAKLNYPLIVKPVDSNSSKGVRRVDSFEELEFSLLEAIRISRTADAIVEEYVSGREIGVDCIVVDGKASVIMTKDRRKIELDYETSQQIQGCYWPADISELIANKFEKIANQIADAFQLKNTPLMLQVILKQNGDVSVIEFGARIGGGESFRIIKRLTDFDYVDAAIDSFLGNKLLLNAKEPEKYFADSFLYTKQCEFGEIIFPSELIENGVLEYLNQYRVRGVKIGAELTSNNRVGVFAVSSTTKEDLISKTNEVLQKLDILDIHGQSVMRKDIYN